jgi:hypothetical protein
VGTATTTPVVMGGGWTPPKVSMWMG